MSTPPDLSSPPAPAPIVIDTQVVMDWLLFRDPSCAALGEAVTQARLSWHSSPRMYAELLHVLGRGVAAAWQPDLQAIAAHFEQHACRPTQEPPSALHLLRCRDPDDQMFLDLAVAVKARWLFSRDRAVLALAKRARAHGIEIITPLAWNKQQSAVR
jgi:putative PIN family toxin of toxin-antitoxin system